MSSLVSGVTKIFSAVGTGIGAAAATLGSAVKAVGSSLFTAGAASGSGIASGGGFFSNLLGSGSTLGNMFSGVANVLGLGPPGSVGQLAGAAGSLGAETSTGLKGLGGFFESPLGEAALGAAQGWAESKAQDRQIEAVRGLQNDRIAADKAASDRITNSYNVPNSALVGGSLEASAPQAVTQATTPRQTPSVTRQPKTMWAYNKDTQMLEKRAVA